MAGRLVIGLCLAVLTLTGCAGDPVARPERAPAPAPRTLQDSWSQLYVAVQNLPPAFFDRPDSRSSRPLGDHFVVRSLTTVRDQRRGCFSGPHGARLTVGTAGRAHATHVYRFSRGTCTYRGGTIVLRQPPGLETAIVRGSGPCGRCRGCGGGSSRTGASASRST